MSSSINLNAGQPVNNFNQKFSDETSNFKSSVLRFSQNPKVGRIALGAVALAATLGGGYLTTKSLWTETQFPNPNPNSTQSNPSQFNASQVQSWNLTAYNESFQCPFTAVNLTSQSWETFTNLEAKKPSEWTCDSDGMCISQAKDFNEIKPRNNDFEKTVDASKTQPDDTNSSNANEINSVSTKNVTKYNTNSSTDKTEIESSYDLNMCGLDEAPTNATANQNTTLANITDLFSITASNSKGVNATNTSQVVTTKANNSLVSQDENLDYYDYFFEFNQDYSTSAEESSTTPLPEKSKKKKESPIVDILNQQLTSGRFGLSIDELKNAFNIGPRSLTVGEQRALYVKEIAAPLKLAMDEAFQLSNETRKETIGYGACKTREAAREFVRQIGPERSQNVAEYRDTNEYGHKMGPTCEQLAMKYKYDWRFLGEKACSPNGAVTRSAENLDLYFPFELLQKRLIDISNHYTKSHELIKEHCNLASKKLTIFGNFVAETGKPVTDFVSKPRNSISLVFLGFFGKYGVLPVYRFLNKF